LCWTLWGEKRKYLRKEVPAAWWVVTNRYVGVNGPLGGGERDYETSDLTRTDPDRTVVREVPGGKREVECHAV